MTTQLKTMIENLLKSLDKFPCHLFAARRQWKQWNRLIENLPPSHVAVEMDFAENMSRVYQEEVQSLHREKTQTMIHYVVVSHPSIHQT